MFNGDSRRALDVYVSLNEKIRAEYGKGSIETSERLLELVGLDENEPSEYWQMFETLMKDNEKGRVARGETISEEHISRIPECNAGTWCRL